MRLSWLAVGNCLVLLVLAGCAAPAADSLSKPTQTRPTAADVGTGAGQILGLVIDDEQRPVQGARVQSASQVPSDNSTPADLQTGTDGRFTLSNLADGTYLIQVSKPGYEPIPIRRVDVKDGETVEFTTVLVPLPAAAPYSTLYNKKSLYNTVCYPRAGPLVNICLGTLAGNNQNLLNPNDPNTYAGQLNHKSNESATNPLQTILVEARWTDGPGVCKVGTKMDIFGPAGKKQYVVNTRSSGADDPNYWSNLPNVSNPVRWEIPRYGDSPDAMWGPERTDNNDGEPIKVEGDWEFRWWSYNGPTANDPSCAIDVKVELWFSFFYTESAKSGYSAFAA